MIYVKRNAQILEISEDEKEKYIQRGFKEWEPPEVGGKNVKNSK